MGLQLRPACAEIGLTAAPTRSWSQFDASESDSNVWLPKIQIVRIRDEVQQIRTHTALDRARVARVVNVTGDDESGHGGGHEDGDFGEHCWSKIREISGELN